MKTLLSLLSMLPLLGYSQFELDPMTGSNMVLQRKAPVMVRGKAVPGTNIRIRYLDYERSDVTRVDSTWEISFPAQEASSIPEMMNIYGGKDSICLDNIMVGDIWICTGQSNMEWPLRSEKHFTEEIQNSDQPLVRFYNPTYAGKGIYGTTYPDSIRHRLYPDKFYQGSWQQCDSNSSKDMSAVAYYFAKQLVLREMIPIGVVNLSIGGAPIETFISREALASSEVFSKKIKGNWLENDNLPLWVRERAQQNIGLAVDIQGDSLGPNHPYKPGFAYEAGIAPLTTLSVTGFLFYQGESNAQELDRVEEYADLMKLMITDYRKKWSKPAMPFYWVQLSSIDTLNYRSQLWPMFRDKQRNALDLIKNGGMCVSSDVGAPSDIHPRNKKVIGERLALLAFKYYYGHNEVVASGPLPRDAKYKKGNIIVRFTNATDWLETSDGKDLSGFSLDGIHEADAIIKGKQVIIPVTGNPKILYYGWQPYCIGNLVNNEGLPASTFRIPIK